MLDEWKVSHIFREGNSPSDFMAVGGSKGIVAEYVMSNLPFELYTLL